MAAPSIYDHRFNDLDNFGYEELEIDNFGSFGVRNFGWHGGVQAGWNWQRGCTVFGVQADWSWTNARINSFHTDLDPDYSIGVTSRMNWFGTARTKAGVVVDSLLLYVTGGLAFANFDRTIAYNDDGDAGELTGKSTRLGWTAGFGTEWALAPNWSVVSEVLYMAFENDNQTFRFEGDPIRYRFEDSAWVSRIGINYRWGGAAPVVARY